MNRDQGVVRSPWYVRAWGFVLVVLGLLNLLVAVMDSNVQLRVAEWAILLAVPAAGLGLIGEYRWGWLLGVALGFISTAYGIWLLADAILYGLDITLIGLPYVAVFMLIIPGALLLLSLLSTGTRRWLRQTSSGGATRPA
jgi:hypothetical protein